MKGQSIDAGNIGYKTDNTDRQTNNSKQIIKKDEQHRPQQ